MARNVWHPLKGTRWIGIFCRKCDEIWTSD